MLSITSKSLQFLLDILHRKRLTDHQWATIWTKCPICAVYMWLLNYVSAMDTRSFISIRIKTVENIYKFLLFKKRGFWSFNQQTDP